MTDGSVVEYASNPPAEIIARPSRSYRLKWCVMGLVLIGYGAWSLYDGFVRYPEANAHALRPKDQGGLGLTVPPHPGLDIPFNQWIGMILPVVGLFAAGWALYNSRGQYRLAGSSLYVPGHPEVPLDSIRAIDKTKWERKGIAYIDYELAGSGNPSRLKLDDYVYERRPTDEIMERIEALVAPPAEDVAADATDSQTVNAAEDRVAS